MTMHRQKHIPEMLTAEEHSVGDHGNNGEGNNRSFTHN
jgi:hypothetical protein